MEGWEALEQKCLNCTGCGLCETRHHVVFGVGNRETEVLFVGEGPGEQEDLQGEPFVGPAGKLLDGLIDHCCDWSKDTCGILTHCTASYHDDAAGVHTNIVYGDYFFVEALARIAGTDPELWRR